MRSRPHLLALPCLLLALLATGFKEPLTWAPPPLQGDVWSVDVPVSGGDWYGVPNTRDCLLRMPAVPVQRRVKLHGCRNVRVVGGEFRSDADPCSADANGLEDSAALYLQEFAGIAHVEGMKIHGRGFSDGIWMTSTLPGSTGQVEGSWIGGLGACSEPASGFVSVWPNEHPDCFQTWLGPSVLRFDKNTCLTIFQGINVDSNSMADGLGKRHPSRLIDIRRTNVRLDERTPSGRHCFTAWSSFNPAPTRLTRAYCATGASGFAPVWPGVASDPAWWSDVRYGVPGGRNEIASTEAGIGYSRADRSAPKQGPGEERGSGPGSNGDRRVRMSAPGRLRLRRALARGLPVRVRCPRACNLIARLRVGAPAARRLRLGRNRRIVANGRAVLHGVGARNLIVRFGRRARRRLATARRVELTLAATVREAGARRPVLLERRVILTRRIAR